LDIDGDGKADYKTGLYPFSYQFNRSQPVHLMQKVTDGLGMETVFEFKPLTDSTVHAKLSNAVYPVADLVDAVHVVSRMRLSDGIGGYFDTNYSYTGFKVDKSGRGSLGFSSATAEDVDRKVKTLTTYSQSFPTVGLATAVDVTITDKLDNGTNQLQQIAGTSRSYTVRNGVTSFSGPPIKYVCLNTDTTVEYDVESGASLRTVFTDNDPTDGGVPCDALGHPGQPGTADANGTPLSRRVTVTDHVPNPDVLYRTDTVTYYNETFVAGLSTLMTRQIAKPLVDGVGDATKDRTTAVSYVLNKGTVSQVVREPDQAAPIKLTTAFGYDNFGNRTSETITPSETGGTPTPPLARTETVQYDAVGRFPDLLTNAVGHVTDLGFEPKFGTVLTVDGPNATNGAFNDLITRTYDAFGRMKDERHPDGSYQVVYLKTVASGAIGIADRPQAKIMIETSLQNTAWGTTPTTRFTPVRTFLDGLGRELRTRSRAFDATNFVHVDTVYDSRGRVQQTSEPYYETQTPTWNTPAYDVLDRAVGVTAADATQSTTTDYNGFTVTTTDAGGRQNRLISDALGRAIRTENLNASGVTLAVTQYLYDKAGNLTTVQKRTAGDALIANTVITSTFDRLGRPLTTTDPDFGAGANGRVDFLFDSMSDLRRQQTPRLRAQSATLYTEFDYDRLARMTTRRDPSTNLTLTVTSTFTFDQVTPAGCEAGIGQLTTEAISGGGEPGLTTTYCYSPAQLGRLANEQRTTEGVTYQTDLTYDVLGRLSQVRYPATTTWPSGSRYAVNYSYTPRGHLERIQEAQGSSTVLFQNVGANARGQLEKAYLGDGSRTTRGFVKNTDRLAFTNAAAGTPQVQNFAYGYDAVGNMSGRADLLNSVSETFGYDALDRLTGSTVTNGTGPHSVTYAYDDAAGNLGNMTHKSDISSLPSASMTYSTTGRPHALATLAVSGTDTRTFTYNANGALTGGQVATTARTLDYTSYDMLASATIGTTSRTFYYGPDRKRYKQVSVAGASTRFYTYIGEHYVKEVEGAATEHKLYIIANDEPVAYVSDDGTPDTRYLHKDHLGSITTIVTNQNVAGSEKLSYDAWGKRRHGTDWWSVPSAASEERGYTGHEHLDNVNLIHMNGRVYDPQLARFTSPDPFVSDPLYSQSYNRYAYVHGNPLKYTDPSGFSPCPPGEEGYFCGDMWCMLGGWCWNGPDWDPCLLDPFCSPNNDTGFNFVPRDDPSTGGGTPVEPEPELPLPVPPTSGPGSGGTDTGGTPPATPPSPVVDTESFGFNPTQPFVITFGLTSSDAAKAIEAAEILRERHRAQHDRDWEIIKMVYVPDFRCIFVGDNCSGLGRAVEVISVIPIAKVLKGVKIGKAAKAAGAAAAERAARIERVAKALDCGCFVAGTLVETAAGLIPIEEIEVGDEVWSRDEQTGELALKPVTALLRPPHRPVWKVTYEIDEGTSVTYAEFETTDDHPWGRIDGTWLRTDELKPGTQILRAHGVPARVVSVGQTERTEPTYNLEVADFHTYFVGEAWVWVHNAKPCTLEVPHSARGPEIPWPDATGRYHGDIPSSVPKEWKAGEVDDAIEGIQRSIEQRTRDMARIGPNSKMGGHSERIRRELNYLKQLMVRRNEIGGG
jgi:RHS repeat-associated protein